ncbi:MAG: 50S ribosomal protein L11 [Candidatus Pacearchaeota archaeon]
MSHIKLLVEGGSMQPGPTLSQQIGPLGLNIGQIISKVNDATKDFKGIKVPIELDINISTKEFIVKVFSPPVSELLKKEIGIEKGSGAQKKTQVANASIEQIISVAKQKSPNLLCNDLKSAVKTIVGTCVTLGILIENKSAKEIEQEIDAGKYDKEIKEGKTKTSPEKKIELEKYFSDVKGKQEALKKAEEVAKAAAEESKATATTEKKEEPVKEKAPKEKK